MYKAKNTILEIPQKMIKRWNGDPVTSAQPVMHIKP